MRRLGILLLLLVIACNEPADNISLSDSDSAPGPAAMATANQADTVRDQIPLGRLPGIATPKGYALEMVIDPDQESFSGHVDIAVELHQATDHLFMHGKNLRVSATKVILQDGGSLAATYEQVDSGGVVRINFPRTLAAGPIALEFDYQADFGKRLHGLFKVEEDGRAYAFTQMESVYAREAFPAFDEPAFKTPFEVSLVIRQDHTGLANTPLIEEMLLENGLKRLRFARTPPITTYLLALAVGPLDVVESLPLPANSVRTQPLPFRGVAAHGKGKDLAYALAETGAILTALENYFDMPYPYAKLDIIAVPDFEAGAMENVGAVTFRESLLLLKKDAPPQQRRAFARVMAHELAHMWFGDLVTMPWWDDIWLNESFATWMSYKAVEEYAPSQKPFIAQIRRTQRAYKDDALLSARQIREPVLDNDGIVEAFDGITYAKGGAVLSMFEQYLGKDIFRQGVRDHMRRFAHGSADVNDLIDSLSKASGKTLAPAFETFLFQSGVPQVDVSIDCKNHQIKLSQSRYLPIGTHSDEQRLWKIPACIKYGSGDKMSEQCVLIEAPVQVMEIDGDCPDWVLPNANFAGYYHWMLPADYYQKLNAAGTVLNEREWMSVVDSTRSGLANGHLSVAQSWEIIEQLAASPYPNVARGLMPVIRFMEDYLADDPKVRATIRTRAAALYRPLQAHRAFDKSFMQNLEPGETRVHYSNVASFMSKVARDPQTREAALGKARAYMDSKADANVSKGSLETVLIVGVQDGGATVFEPLLKQFVNSNDAWFRDVALSALAATRDPELGRRVRDLALSENLRANEISTLISAHVLELDNVPATWQWLQKNYAALQARMPPRHVPRLAILVKKMCDLSWVEPMDKFYRPHLQDIAGGTRYLNTALETLQVCAAAATVQRPQANQFFIGGHRR